MAAHFSQIFQFHLVPTYIEKMKRPLTISRANKLPIPTGIPICPGRFSFTKTTEGMITSKIDEKADH